MDVGEWLRGLGLGQYGQKFRENKIEADVLADLTDGDFEKLGIPLGDRKRLLKAIAANVAPERRSSQSRLVTTAHALAPQTFARPDDAERKSHRHNFSNRWPSRICSARKRKWHLLS
jgi:SAM domain (Sterile alpha motif)